MHEASSYGPFTEAELREFMQCNSVPHTASVRQENRDGWIPFSQLNKGPKNNRSHNSASYSVSLSIHFRIFITFSLLAVSATVWSFGQLNSWAVTSAIFLHGNLSNLLGPLLLAIASSITAYFFATRILKLHATLIAQHLQDDDEFRWSFFRTAEAARNTNELSKKHLSKEHLINPVLAQFFMVFGPSSFIPFVGHYFFLTFLLIMPGLVGQFYLASRTLATRLP
ncbi:MAG: hypothetical protein ACJZ8O_06905 [Pirellulaceae bacterium]